MDQFLSENDGKEFSSGNVHSCAGSSIQKTIRSSLARRMNPAKQVIGRCKAQKGNIMCASASCLAAGRNATGSYSWGSFAMAVP